VSEILLRGIFFLRESEIQWYYQEGASHIFPDTWEIYKNAIPENERHDFVKAYHRRLKGEMGQEEMQKAAIGKTTRCRKQLD
jgi:proline iminopeptidase